MEFPRGSRSYMLRLVRIYIESIEQTITREAALRLSKQELPQTASSPASWSTNSSIASPGPACAHSVEIWIDGKLLERWDLERLSRQTSKEAQEQIRRFSSSSKQKFIQVTLPVTQSFEDKEAGSQSSQSSILKYIRLYMGNYQDFHTATRFFSVDAGFSHNEIPVHASQPIPIPRPLSATSMPLESVPSRGFLDPLRRPTSRISNRGPATPPITVSSQSSSRLGPARANTRTPSQSSTQTSASSLIFSAPPLPSQSRIVMMASEPRDYGFVRNNEERPVETVLGYRQNGFGIQRSESRGSTLRRHPSIRYGNASATAAWQPRSASAQPYGNVYTLQGSRAYPFSQRSAYIEDSSGGLVAQRRNSHSQNTTETAGRGGFNDQVFDDYGTESLSQVRLSIEDESSALPSYRQPLVDFDVNRSMESPVSGSRGRSPVTFDRRVPSPGPDKVSGLTAQSFTGEQRHIEPQELLEDHATGKWVPKATGNNKKSTGKKRSASRQATASAAPKKARLRNKTDGGIGIGGSSTEAVKVPTRKSGTVTPFPDSQQLDDAQKASPKIATTPCTQCRVRKIKCDRVLPMCGNCTKTGKSICVRVNQPPTPKVPQLQNKENADNSAMRNEKASEKETDTAMTSPQARVTRRQAKARVADTALDHHLKNSGALGEQRHGNQATTQKSVGMQTENYFEGYLHWTRALVRVKDVEKRHQDETVQTLSGSSPGSPHHRAQLLKVARASLGLERDIRRIWMEL